MASCMRQLSLEALCQAQHHVSLHNLSPLMARGTAPWARAGSKFRRLPGQRRATARLCLVTPWVPLSHRSMMWQGQLMMGETVPAEDFFQLVTDSIDASNFRHLTELLLQFQHSPEACALLEGSTALEILFDALSDAGDGQALQQVSAAAVASGVPLSQAAASAAVVGLATHLPQSPVLWAVGEAGHANGDEKLFVALLRALTAALGEAGACAAVVDALEAPMPQWVDGQLVLQPPAGGARGDGRLPLADRPSLFTPALALEVLGACGHVAVGQLPHTLVTAVLAAAGSDPRLQAYLDSPDGKQALHFAFVRALLRSGDAQGAVAAFESLLEGLEGGSAAGAELCDSDSDSETGHTAAAAEEGGSDGVWRRGDDTALPPAQALGVQVLADLLSTSEGRPGEAAEALSAAAQLAFNLLLRCRVIPDHGSFMRLLRELYAAGQHASVRQLVEAVPPQEARSGAVLAGHVNVALRSMVAQGELDAVQAAVRVMQRVGGSIAPDGHTWGLLVDSLTRAGRLAEASAAAEKLAAEGGSAARLASLRISIALRQPAYERVRGSGAGEAALRRLLEELCSSAPQHEAAGRQRRGEGAPGHISDGMLSDSDGPPTQTGGGLSESLGMSLARAAGQVAPPPSDLDEAPFNQILSEAVATGQAQLAAEVVLALQASVGRPSGASLLAALSGLRHVKMQRQHREALQAAAEALVAAGLPPGDSIAVCDQAITQAKRGSGRWVALSLLATLHSAGLFGERLRPSEGLRGLLPSVALVDVADVSPTVRGLYVQWFLWQQAGHAAQGGVERAPLKGRSLHFRLGDTSEERGQRHAAWLVKEVQACTAVKGAPRVACSVTQQSVAVQWAHLAPWLVAASQALPELGPDGVSVADIELASSGKQRVARENGDASPSVAADSPTSRVPIKVTVE